MTSVAHIFDSAAIAYDQQLQSGLSLSGETADYFVRERVDMFAELLGRYNLNSSARLLDFGCGIGNATQRLLERFPNSHLTGLDCSAESLSVAQRRYGSFTGLPPRLRWSLADESLAANSFDAVYTSGVFHHIEPRLRQSELARIHTWLRPGGVLALFENNPWNPATRLVMSRIPFDRDAICLSPFETRRRLRDAGFLVSETRYLFFFPRKLSLLRRFERYLSHFQLGAQYVVFAHRPLS